MLCFQLNLSNPDRPFPFLGLFTLFETDLLTSPISVKLCVTWEVNCWHPRPSVFLSNVKCQGSPLGLKHIILCHCSGAFEGEGEKQRQAPATYLPAVCQHKRLRDSQSFPLTWPWTANVVAMSWGCSHGPRCSNRRPGWYQGQSGWYFLCGAVIQVLSLFTFQIRHVGLGHNRLSWSSPVAWTQINLSPSMYLWCMASFLIADNSKHRIACVVKSMLWFLHLSLLEGLISIFR